MIWFNFSRIQLLVKGYSFSQQNDILSLSGDEVDEVLSHDKMEHIQDWIKESEEVNIMMSMNTICLYIKI